MFTTRLIPAALVLALVGLLFGHATGQQGEKKPTTDKSLTDKPMPMNVTPEREAAVRTFVERNHPELAELLTHLKSNKPQEYERAIRELHRITERLAGIQERDRDQYDLEIKLWTAQSRVQLLTAKLRMGATDELKDQLRGALNTQAEAKVALLKHERERVATRLTKIDADIAQFENNRDQVIEKQMELLEKTARGSAGPKGRDLKPGVKGTVNKPAGKGSAKRPAKTGTELTPN
jgi:hypothetical protein